MAAAFWRILIDNLRNLFGLKFCDVLNILSFKFYIFKEIFFNTKLNKKEELSVSIKIYRFWFFCYLNQILANINNFCRIFKFFLIFYINYFIRNFTLENYY